MTRHIHADLIHAWADGAMIQELSPGGSWHPCLWPLWKPDKTYRLKPEPPKFPASTLSDKTLVSTFGDCPDTTLGSLRAVADAAVKEYLLTQQESTDGMAQFCKQRPQKEVPLPDLGGTGPRPGLVPIEQRWMVQKSIYAPLNQNLYWVFFEDLGFSSEAMAKERITYLRSMGYEKEGLLRAVAVEAPLFVPITKK